MIRIVTKRDEIVAESNPQWMNDTVGQGIVVFNSEDKFVGIVTKGESHNPLYRIVMYNGSLSATHVNITSLINNHQLYKFYTLRYE